MYFSAVIYYFLIVWCVRMGASEFVFFRIKTDFFIFLYFLYFNFNFNYIFFQVQLKINKLWSKLHMKSPIYKEKEVLYIS